MKIWIPEVRISDFLLYFEATNLLVQSSRSFCLSSEHQLPENIKIDIDTDTYTLNKSKKSD